MYIATLPDGTTVEIKAKTNWRNVVVGNNDYCHNYCLEQFGTAPKRVEQKRVQYVD